MSPSTLTASKSDSGTIRLPASARGYHSFPKFDSPQLFENLQPEHQPAPSHPKINATLRNMAFPPNENPLWQLAPPTVSTSDYKETFDQLTLDSTQRWRHGERALKAAELAELLHWPIDNWRLVPYKDIRSAAELASALNINEVSLRELLNGLAKTDENCYTSNKDALNQLKQLQRGCTLALHKLARSNKVTDIEIRSTALDALSEGKGAIFNRRLLYELSLSKDPITALHAGSGLCRAPWRNMLYIIRALHLQNHPFVKTTIYGAWWSEGLASIDLSSMRSWGRKLGKSLKYLVPQLPPWTKSR